MIRCSSCDLVFSLSCDISILSCDPQRLQQVIDEREQIEQDYATLENDFVLCQSELCAARDRISRLMTHLERSEKMVAVMQEAKDGLQGKVGGVGRGQYCVSVFVVLQVDSLELEKQFLQRKITRLVVQPRAVLLHTKLGRQTSSLVGTTVMTTYTHTHSHVHTHTHNTTHTTQSPIHS